MKALLYRFNRWLLGSIARPTHTGTDNAPAASAEAIYVLHHRALTDLIMLDLVCKEAELTSPLDTLQIGEVEEDNRIFTLFRAKAGRMTMPAKTARLRRLLNAPPEIRSQIYLVPVSVFWGRAMSAEGSIFKNLTSEHWAVTGRFKRLLNLIINRRNIFVHTGRPISLEDICDGDTDKDIIAKRTARLLRVRLRQQKQTAIGPDFSHRRTLLNQVTNAKSVRDVISAEVQAGKKQSRTERLARKYARTIASDMSHPTIRILAGLLRWFWNKIYDGIEVNGLEALEEVSGTHSLVYVPSHRSHLDYLLLSYLLYYRGFMIPHIAAGDNLNLPILGGILRRGGAFFMRRSFRDDPLYAAVFNEYLYQVYRRGHCVEFFPEGGRTRTGRLLPARMGLLKMTVDHQVRGLPKPLALVPVYFGYEKVVEGSSYLSELRGANKKSESIADIFRNLKLIRQTFGSVKVNMGAPIKLDEWLEEHGEAADLELLGRKIMVGINAQANINAVNLVALATLSTPKIAIESQRLHAQIACMQRLLQGLTNNSHIQVCTDTPQEIVAHVEQLGMLSRDAEPFGDVFTHDPFTAVLMTWYRNNVIHTLALPSLIACLMVKRRRGISQERLLQTAQQIFPHLAAELSCADDLAELDSCLAVMVELGLLNFSDGDYSTPNPAQRQHYELTLLANLVSQTLERMFIVIHQLSQAQLTREEIRTRSQLVAQRISRLYGINAPEFSDQRLFDLFIDGLISRGVVTCEDDDTLSYDPILDNIVRAAEFVIDAQIRHGVMSADL